MAKYDPTDNFVLFRLCTKVPAAGLHAGCTPQIQSLIGLHTNTNGQHVSTSSLRAMFFGALHLLVEWILYIFQKENEELKNATNFMLNDKL